MQSARKIADKIAMIYHGKIIWTDKVENLDSSNNGFVDQFINGRATGPIKMQMKKT
jgi:phospholipid/cholesterol/gamma-HCH transport system ATP-binding protein